MLPLFFDENVNQRIIRAIRLRVPGLDAITAQEAKLRGAEDPDLLEWAAQSGRVLVTHDVATMPAFAYDRLRAGRPMSGIIAIPNDLSIRAAILDLELIVRVCTLEDVDSRVLYLPM